MEGVSVQNRKASLHRPPGGRDVSQFNITVIVQLTHNEPPVFCCTAVRKCVNTEISGPVTEQVDGQQTRPAG